MQIHCNMSLKIHLRLWCSIFVPFSILSNYFILSSPSQLCLSGSLIHTVRNTDALTHVIRAIYRSYCAITLWRMKRAYPDDDHAQYVETKTKSQIYIPDHRLSANTYIHDSVKLYLILLSTFISIILYSENYR